MPTMPRSVYLGERVSLTRGHTDPGTADQHVIPGLSIVDPDAEPIQVNVAIPDYDGSFAPLREVHVFAYPEGTEIGPAEQLLAAPPEFQAHTDVTNVKNATISLDLAGLPDGPWFLQSVLVAGSD